jgi:hypothetical protein
MNDLNSDEKIVSGCCSQGESSFCCQPSDGKASTCCGPEDGSRRKVKLLISVIVIIAALGVGANSYVRGTSVQSDKAGPAKSFSSTLMEFPAPATENNVPDAQQTKTPEIPINPDLDSVQSLDTLAADKDVIFLVLRSDVQIPTIAIPAQVRTVANNLLNSGQRVGVFTLKNSAPDYDQLVRRFAITAFPCVIILGRQGSATAVVGDITEARLYNAFVMASTTVSCCPGQGSASCCPK